MNENITKKGANHYDGNGWSRYQIMVLQQLEDHNKVLQNLNKEIVDLKQTIAVSETELKMWRAQIMLSVTNLEKNMDEVLYDENGLNSRVSKLERDTSIEQQLSTKIKATWAFVGAIIMFTIDIAIKIISTFWK